MAFCIQYDKATGQITGTVMTDRPPVFAADSPRQQLQFKEHVDVRGKRVSAAGELEDCPIYAKNAHNASIQFQLDAIDRKTMRALRDLHLKGDKAPLQKLEDDAEALRKQLVKD